MRVGPVSPDDGVVGAQAVFQDAIPPVNGAGFLALCDEGAGAGGRIESVDAGAAGPQSLRQSSLRRQLQVNFAPPVGQLKLGGAGHRGRDGERGNGLGDLPVFNQYAVVNGGAARRGAEADDPRDAGGVADDGEVAAAPVAQGQQKVMGHPAGAAEAVNKDGGAVGHIGEGRSAVGINLAGRGAGRGRKVHRAQ